MAISSPIQNNVGGNEQNHTKGFHVFELSQNPNTDAKDPIPNGMLGRSRTTRDDLRDESEE